MSVSFVKSIIEGQDIKIQTPTNIGIDMNKKCAYFTLVKKIVEKNTNK